MKQALLIAVGVLVMSSPSFSQGSTETELRGGRAYDLQDRQLAELLSGVGDVPSGRRLGRGAGFLLRSGDTTVAVRCDPQETMRACVEATTTLLERARATLPSRGNPGTQPPQ